MSRHVWAACMSVWVMDHKLNLIMHARTCVWVYTDMVEHACVDVAWVSRLISSIDVQGKRLKEKVRITA